ncbi:MAG: type II toxin-antitoxin system prevent-host-death family antitoxin [bacterium]
MTITVSTLRQNIYNLLDRVIETGEPIEISRKGALLQIAPLKKQKKVQRLKKRKIMKSDPESIVHIDWSYEWKV